MATDKNPWPSCGQCQPLQEQLGTDADERTEQESTRHHTRNGRLNSETLTLPGVTAITQQEAILTVAGPTHFTVCLLQVRIYCFLLPFLHRLLHSDLSEATRERNTNKSVWTAQRNLDLVHQYKGDLNKDRILGGMGAPRKEQCTNTH